MFRSQACLVLTLGLAALAGAEDLPSVTYGAVRSSQRWVGTETSAQVAIDQGITFQGVSYYVSLTSDLLALPEGAEHATWLHSISAFWDRLGIERVTTAGGETVLALVLRNSPRGDEPSLMEARDLQTGEVIDLGAEKLGEAVKVRELASGSDSVIPEGFQELLGSREELDGLVGRMFAPGDAPALPEVNFADEVVLAVSYGDSVNCRGLTCVQAWLDDQRLLVRFAGRFYQTAQIALVEGEEEVPQEEEPPERPYALWALPRQTGRALIVEHNVQRYIGGPPLWKVVREFDRIPGAE